MASRVLGNMLARRGLRVTIGETFGASQRGGSVMSHLRVSARAIWSPQIPRGRCDLLIALEPTEALRVLALYGHPGTIVLCNTRPVHAIGVICGAQAYPRLEELKSWIRELCGSAWFLDATEKARALGNPILGNSIMIGAAAASGSPPLSREDFEAVMARSLAADKLQANLKAFDLGFEMAADPERWKQ
jgi:indolepyruvate ferredoxin oxidoreductase beta subunit